MKLVYLAILLLTSLNCYRCQPDLDNGSLEQQALVYFRLPSKEKLIEYIKAVKEFRRLDTQIKELYREGKINEKTSKCLEEFEKHFGPTRWRHGFKSNIWILNNIRYLRDDFESIRAADQKLANSILDFLRFIDIKFDDVWPNIHSVKEFEESHNVSVNDYC